MDRPGFIAEFSDGGRPGAYLRIVEEGEIGAGDIPEILVMNKIDRLTGSERARLALAEQGMAVLLISSELEEVLGLAHRVLVLRRGRIVAEYDKEATMERVMAAAFAADTAEVVA